MNSHQRRTERRKWQRDMKSQWQHRGQSNQLNFPRLSTLPKFTPATNVQTIAYSDAPTLPRRIWHRFWFVITTVLPGIFRIRLLGFGMESKSARRKDEN